MKDTLWKELEKLKGRELHTLDRNNPFQLVEVGESRITLQIGNTGKKRTLSRTELESAWQTLVSHKELSRVEIRAQYSNFNPAYVAAILSALPGVRHEKKPIRLFYAATQ